MSRKRIVDDIPQWVVTRLIDAYERASEIKTLVAMATVAEFLRTTERPMDRGQMDYWTERLLSLKETDE